MADTGEVIAWVAKELRSRGERMTGPRTAVLTALGEHPGHLTVEDVVEAVAAVDSSVHRSSVYRALEALCELGVVQHIHLSHGTTAYHLSSIRGPHPHDQCVRCGVVQDLPADLLDDVAARLVAAAGIAVALRGSRSELDERSAPLAGLTATLVFAAQMINFPVAAGTSGHLLGGALAAVLVGPWTCLLYTSDAADDLLCVDL